MANGRLRPFRQFVASGTWRAEPIMAAETEGYLIRGGRIYDHDGDIHQPATADLLIRGGPIARIAPHIATGDGVEVVEAAGKLVVPGFVNAHYHSHDVMAKGMFEEMPFD